MNRSHITTIIILLSMFLGRGAELQAQQRPVRDTSELVYPVKEKKDVLDKYNNLIELNDPANVTKTVEFDPLTNTYEIVETIGGRPYRRSQKMTFEEYRQYQLEETKKDYWSHKSGGGAAGENRGILPKIDLKSKTLASIFGGSFIDIRPQGFAEVTLSARFNKNENPLFNTRQRKQTSLDFDERLQINLTGSIGEKLKINTNFNTQAQFDFENQIKFEYTGHEDEILRKVEVGNVSLPIQGSLINGSQSLFGLKAQAQFGRLGVTGIFSQQRSEAKTIDITNGSQETIFEVKVDNYEANRHYFLAQFFRDNYNKSLASRPGGISSGVTISKVEVWVTNKSNTNTDSRDILAFIDLGERNTFNPSVRDTRPSVPLNPVAFGKVQPQSNLLLGLIGNKYRGTSNNDISGEAAFLSTGGTDNYAKLNYARKLNDREYKLEPSLGYISLNQPLNNDEVLAVSFRYTYLGNEYQVGEFSTDIPVDPNERKVLYTKLLKNELIKITLPTWNLMMKNIYGLNAYQVSQDQFRLNILRLDNTTGIQQAVMTETSLQQKSFLELTTLDRLDSQGGAQPDGVFDFLQGITVDAQNGRLIFPVLEPFGADLRTKFTSAEVSPGGLGEKYIFSELYDETRFVAQQALAKNRYVIKGSYRSSSSSEFNLNAINIPEGSVKVNAGPVPMIEGVDFTVDYNLGRVKILNEALLNAGTPISIQLESTALFGAQSRTLMGARMDYVVNDNLTLGGTILNLSERPLTQNVNIGDESINNTIYGFDAHYRSESRFLTRLVNKLPYVSTTVPSTISFMGEFAHFLPGHSKALDIAGDEGGVSYLDDFENTRSVIDLKSFNNWFISGVPQGLDVGIGLDSLRSGYNRALLAYYTIDPVFYALNNSATPSNIKGNLDELSRPYSREVLEQEVFPNKQSATGSPILLPTFDMAFYPQKRGPYNFNPDLNADGNLKELKSKWGGIFRKLDQNDFQALNVEYIEFWVMDPFIDKLSSRGGELRFDLGSMSEDILPDANKSLENALPANGDINQTIRTPWGRVGKIQPVTQAFDNDPEVRRRQDVGIDGLSSEEERNFASFQPFLNAVRGRVTDPAALAEIEADPAGDDFNYFRGPRQDNVGASILDRYMRYNGMEGNSKTTAQSQQDFGVENAASTPTPDGEDINRDNNMSTAEAYFEYTVKMNPGNMQVGASDNPYLNDVVTSSVLLKNGERTNVKWYQFRIPLEGERVAKGGIEDLKSIRFIRMYMTDFDDPDPVVLRFAKLQLVRGEWKVYNPSKTPDDEIKYPGVSPSLNNPVPLTLAAINIEENGDRESISYVIPPGIVQQQVQGVYKENVRLNEQSLLLRVNQLQEGLGQAGYKTINFDFRSYKRLKMFVHAESPKNDLVDGNVRAFVRLGSDFKDNYYEYEIPLKLTLAGAGKDANAIWPEENNFDIDLNTLTALKIERNKLGIPVGQLHAVVGPGGRGVIRIIGQPDLSQAKVMMVGVKNPWNGAEDPLDRDPNDNALPIDAEVWFNELRVADFKEDGGIAMTGVMNMKLADLATINLAGSLSTFGFGSLDRSVNDVNRTKNITYDTSLGLEVGKLLPPSINMSIPFYISYAKDTKKPEYSPLSPDLLLTDVLNSMEKADADRFEELVNDITRRNSLNFTNVRKNRSADAKVDFFDIENFNFTYAYTRFKNTSYIVENNEQRQYRAVLGYNYQKESLNVKPFGKLIKGKGDLLGLVRDFNLNLAPQVFDFQYGLERMYSENAWRATEGDIAFVIPTTYSKTYYLRGLYNIGWDLTPSLRVDYSAESEASVDEPGGAITPAVRDSIRTNLMKFGRPTDFSQRTGITYTLPFSKVKYLSFISANVRYGADYNWRSELLSTLLTDDRFGNSIQNLQTIQYTGQLNLAQLYNKIKFLKDPDPKSYDGGDVGRGLITMFKNINATYSSGRGMFLPGYTPETNIFGTDPGFGFIFGSQKDIRRDLASRGDISFNPDLNDSFLRTKKKDFNYRVMTEPVRELKIELTGLRNMMDNDVSVFRFDDIMREFRELSPSRTGMFSISTIALNTAFGKSGGEVFSEFQANRGTVSRRLGAANPNSVGAEGEFADGYGPGQQDVLVNSFLAAYLGKDAGSAPYKTFAEVPLPNWRVTYTGLNKLPFIADVFSSLNLSHSYKSIYTIAAFNSLQAYQELGGYVSSRSQTNDDDLRNDFLPLLQMNTVTLSEEFVPLLGVDMKFKNNVTANFEYRKSRLMSFSLANAQLSQLNDTQVIFGLGYRTTTFRLPFKIANLNTTDNDLNIRLDFAIRGNKTVIYQMDEDLSQIAGGTSTLSLRPSLDYVINKRFNFRLFVDRNVTKPETSNTYKTSYTNVGLGLRLTL